jgi:hypothetical protein
MKKHQTCPNCGRTLQIVYRPTNSFFQRIGLDNGIFCRSCNARLSVSNRQGFIASVFFIPYIAILSWNIFVAQYGMTHYGFEKLDQYWVIISICIIVVGIVVQSRNKAYVLHRNPSSNAN